MITLLKHMETKSAKKLLADTGCKLKLINGQYESNLLTSCRLPSRYASSNMAPDSVRNLMSASKSLRENSTEFRKTQTASRTSGFPSLLSRIRTEFSPRSRPERWGVVTNKPGTSSCLRIPPNNQERRSWKDQPSAHCRDASLGTGLKTKI